MGKAALILDEMPKNCSECKIAVQDEETGRLSCPVCPYYSYSGPSAWVLRPEGCPLRRLPIRMNPLTADDAKRLEKGNLNVDYHAGYVMGWDAVLDILEGTQDDD